MRSRVARRTHDRRRGSLRLFRGAARTRSSTCRRWRAIRRTTCRAHAASASRQPPSSINDFGSSRRAAGARGRRDQAAEAPRHRLPTPKAWQADPAVEGRSSRLSCDVELATPLDDLRLAEPDAKTAGLLLQGARVHDTHEARGRNLQRWRLARSSRRAHARRDPAGWRTRTGEAAPPPVVVATPASDTHALTPATLAAARIASAKATPVDTKAYVTITDFAVLDRWIAKAHELGRVAIDTETATIDPMQTELLGIALAIGPGEAAYIPLQHIDADADLFAGTGLVAGQLPADDVLARLKPLLEHPGIVKVAQNIKFDWIVSRSAASRRARSPIRCSRPTCSMRGAANTASITCRRNTSATCRCRSARSPARAAASSASPASASTRRPNMLARMPTRRGGCGTSCRCGCRPSGWPASTRRSSARW